MLIRKLFKYESSHQVFDAFSRRCSHSVHGHSYVVEFIFEGNVPDKAHMVMDFGFVKQYFHPFVDAFDHSHILWGDNRFTESNNFFEKNNERWISLPFNSTAEMQAKMFFTYGYWALRELRSRSLINGSVVMSSVKVHETDTGYAEFRDADYHSCQFPKIDLNDIVLSPGVTQEWKVNFAEFYHDVVKGC